MIKVTSIKIRPVPYAETDAVAFYVIGYCDGDPKSYVRTRTGMGVQVWIGVPEFALLSSSAKPTFTLEGAAGRALMDQLTTDGGDDIVSLVP